nr:hypothetical protein CFP56_37174 [Quercus suber]
MTGTSTAADRADSRQAYSPSYSTDEVVQTAVAALSQRPHVSHQQSPIANISNGRKRKATSTAGSRGVANLTPDQLAKKRANDRDAQRAIRERTRNTIEGLERRIKELEGQQAFQDLQRVVAERDQALAECDELRRRLLAVAGIVGRSSPQANASDGLHGESTLEDSCRPPSLTSERKIELAALTAQQSPLPILPQVVPQQVSHSSSPYEAQQYLHPDLRSPHSTNHGSPAVQSPPASTTYHSGDHRKWSASMGHHPSSPQYMPQLGNMSYDSRRSHDSTTIQQQSGDRLDLNYVLDTATHNKPEQSPLTASNNSRAGSRHGSHASPAAARGPESMTWAMTPANCKATCPLDSLLGDFIEARRNQLRNGIPKHEVMGPAQPFWAAFASNQTITEQIQGRHPVSALLIDILSKFPDICRLPEKAAVLYVMFAVLRWQSCPCQECYEMVPDFSKPTPLQIEQAHALWFDHLPWAHMRNNLVKTSVNFEDFFVPYTTTLSLNWPYRDDQVLLRSHDPTDPQDVKLNPDFEAHLRNIDNWSLGPAFQHAHPHLIDEADTDGDLGQHADPEPRVRQTSEAGAEIGKRRSGADAVQTIGTGDDGGNAADDLGRDEGEADVKTHHGLQEDHAIADALDTVEDSEPKP